MNRRTQPAHGLVPGSSEESQLLMFALERNGSNISATARDLGVSRVTLYRMMERNRLSLEWTCRVVRWQRVLSDAAADPARGPATED
jgi:hypothetical protein